MSWTPSSGRGFSRTGNMNSSPEGGSRKTSASSRSARVGPFSRSQFDGPWKLNRTSPCEWEPAWSGF